MKHYPISIPTLILAILFFGTSQAQNTKATLNPKYGFKVDSLIRLMTLEEKVGQKNQ